MSWYNCQWSEWSASLLQYYLVGVLVWLSCSLLCCRCEQDRSQPSKDIGDSKCPHLCWEKVSLCWQRGLPSVLFKPSVFFVQNVTIIFKRWGWTGEFWSDCVDCVLGFILWSILWFLSCSCFLRQSLCEDWTLKFGFVSHVSWFWLCSVLNCPPVCRLWFMTNAWLSVLRSQVNCFSTLLLPWFCHVYVYLLNV